MDSRANRVIDSLHFCSACFAVSVLDTERARALQRFGGEFWLPWKVCGFEAEHYSLILNLQDFNLSVR